MKRLIVCIKPVPDPKHWDKVSLDPGSMTLRREGIPSIMNPLDKHALEAALSIKENEGGEVVLLSMAPPFATSILREGLAMGADKAVLLSDRVFAGSDTLATARILAAGCQWIGEFDLILTGNASIDGSTSQMPSQLGELLGIPSIMHVIALKRQESDTLVVTQKTENASVRLLASPPLLLSVRKELNKPRYISFAGILEAEAKEVTVLSNREIGIDCNLIGLQGSPTKMAGIEIRQFKRRREQLDGPVDEIVKKLADKIYQFGLI